MRMWSATAHNVDMKNVKGTPRVVLIILLSSRPECVSDILSVNVICAPMFFHLIVRGI